MRRNDRRARVEEHGEQRELERVALLVRKQALELAAPERPSCPRGVEGELDVRLVAGHAFAEGGQARGEAREEK